MKIKAHHIELSVIYLTAALFLASVIGLVNNAVSTENIADPYPHLRVASAAKFSTVPGHTIFLTFDDGPSPNTEKVLDVLKKQDAKATFFVTAQNADQPYAAEMLRRIVEEGHSLGLHSYSHNFHEIYRSADSYLQDVDKLNDYLYETVGVRPEILRFPGGSATINCDPKIMKELISQLKQRGYQYYDWDIVSGDDQATLFSAQDLSTRMINGVKGRDSAVILLHDSPAPVTTPQAVEMTIIALREQGYRFERLTKEIPPVHIQTTRFQVED